MKPPEIRRATMADATVIAALANELGYDPNAAEIEERLDALLPLPTRFITVAEVDGEVVGWVCAEHCILLESGPRIEILGLVVGGRHRRGGIGRALVEAAERWQADRLVATILVRSNVVRSESHPFYESLGYVRHKTQHAYIKRRGG